MANLSPYIPIKIYDWYSPGKRVQHIFEMVDLIVISLYKIESHETIKFFQNEKTLPYCINQVLVKHPYVIFAEVLNVR